MSKTDAMIGYKTDLLRITDVGGEAMERQKWFEIIEHYSVSFSLFKQWMIFYDMSLSYY